MDILILRFDGPMMSFGGVMVDQHGPTDRFPGLSLLTGLLGNALGYSHADQVLLQRLQDRIEFAARWDVPPVHVVDYQTVNLDDKKMRDPGWTTRGRTEHRRGADLTKFGTHQRYRHYWANGVMTVAVALKDANESPTVDEAANALSRPARPLFLGRKTCLPASPILFGRVEATDVLEALMTVPVLIRGEGSPANLDACWPAHLGGHDPSQETTVYDRRDWRNQIVTGGRVQAEGVLRMEETA